MLGPRTTEGARAPLFDRLTDLDPRSQTEPRPLRTLNRRELRASVRRELERLLNTRCSIPLPLLYERERSVVDYGIPDFTFLSPQNPDDQRRLAWVLSRTVAAFEPRLRNVRVTVEGAAQNPRALLVRLDGDLVVESITEPVSFPAVVYDKTGEVALLDA